MGSGRMFRVVSLRNEMRKVIMTNALEYLDSGNEYQNMGDIDKAIASYTEAIRLDPNSEYAVFIRDAISELRSGKTIN